jgi:hypothetical protein
VIGDPVEVVNISAVGDGILSFSLCSIPTLSGSLAVALTAPRDTVRRHVQRLDRIRDLGTDLLTEPCRHVEPLDVDDEDVREAVELLDDFAFPMRLAAIAVPRAILQLLLGGEARETLPERDTTVVKSCSFLLLRLPGDLVGLVVSNDPAPGVTGVVDRSWESVPINGDLKSAGRGRKINTEREREC